MTTPKTVTISTTLLIECYEALLPLAWHYGFCSVDTPVKFADGLEARRVITKLKRVAKASGGKLS